MRTFHQNLLIALALGLCALCVYQWYGQTVQRNQINKLNQLLYEKTSAIQGYTNSIRTMDRQVAQMDSGLTELKAVAKANETTLRAQKKELMLLQGDKAVLSDQVNQYKAVLATTTQRLEAAYDGIEKQNDVIKQLTAQRDEFVRKYNDNVTERNTIVKKYNELVKQLGKAQSK